MENKNKTHSEDLTQAPAKEQSEHMDRLLKRHAQFEKLADDIYDLDIMVYQAIGSGLGRVFNNNREYVIRDLVSTMEQTSDAHYLRSAVALIGNMARTIRNKAVHDEIMTKYDEIMHEMADVYDSGWDSSVDMKLAKLNLYNLGTRFSENHHLIICISRTFESGGNAIGLAVADALHIDYYDSEIFAKVLERLEAEKDQLEDASSYKLSPASNQDLSITEMRRLTFRERLSRINRYHGLPTIDAVFFNQSDLLVEMARTQDFVVMGRCADVILTNAGIPHISIFITAPFEHRVHRWMESAGVDEKKAKHTVSSSDKKHAKYYEFFTGRKWGDANNYDLCLNSGSYGIDGTAEFIIQTLKANGIALNRDKVQENLQEREALESAPEKEAHLSAPEKEAHLS